jgi:hypothetical protein
MPWLALTCWFPGNLRAMPHCNNPNDIDFDSIKKAVWQYYHLSVGKFWKFRYDPSGFGKVFKPSQYFFSSIPKIDCRRRLIPTDI